MNGQPAYCSVTSQDNIIIRHNNVQLFYPYKRFRENHNYANMDIVGVFQCLHSKICSVHSVLDKE